MSVEALGKARSRWDAESDGEWISVSVLLIRNVNGWTGEVEYQLKG